MVAATISIAASGLMIATVTTTPTADAIAPSHAMTRP